MFRLEIVNNTLYFVGSIADHIYYRVRFIKDTEYQVEHPYLGENDVGFEMWRCGHVAFHRQLHAYLLSKEGKRFIESI